MISFGHSLFHTQSSMSGVKDFYASCEIELNVFLLCAILIE